MLDTIKGLKNEWRVIKKEAIARKKRKTWNYKKKKNSVEGKKMRMWLRSGENNIHTVIVMKTDYIERNKEGQWGV